MESKKLPQLILQHLLKHPDAGDTLEGITQWWVAQELIDIKMAEVSEAVGFLMEKGMLVEQSIKNSERIYFLNKERIEEVRELVNRDN